MNTFDPTTMMSKTVLFLLLILGIAISVRATLLGINGDIGEFFKIYLILLPWAAFTFGMHHIDKKITEHQKGDM